MNKQETIKIIAIIKMAYPKFFVSENPSEVKLQVETWQDLFSVDSYNLVEEAVKALICTLKYPPTIADVKEKISLITQPERMTEMEAWNMVKGAISYYKAKEGFDGLPTILQKLVGSPNQLREWAIMDTEDVENVVKSNFMRSYTARSKQEVEKALLPESTKVLMRQLSEGFSMERRLTDGRDKQVLHSAVEVR